MGKNVNCFTALSCGGTSSIFHIQASIYRELEVVCNSRLPPSGGYRKAGSGVSPARDGHGRDEDCSPPPHRSRRALLTHRAYMRTRLSRDIPVVFDD